MSVLIVGALSALYGFVYAGGPSDLTGGELVAPELPEAGLTAAAGGAL
jgi:hypothetical protein